MIYERDGWWYHNDETGNEHGPFLTPLQAQNALDKYAYWLEHGPTFWQRIWWPIRYHRLWHRA